MTRYPFELTCLLLFCLAAIGTAGCGKEPDPRGDRIPVGGTVSLDGEPLPRARIVFITDGQTGTVRASATIPDGAFSLSALDGPIAGHARVEIVPELMELEEFEAAQ